MNRLVIYQTHSNTVYLRQVIFVVEDHNTLPLDRVLGMFDQTFGNYGNKVNLRQLPLTSSPWQFVPFEANGSYGRTWFSQFCTRHRYTANQFFLVVKHAFIFERHLCLDT